MDAVTTDVPMRLDRLPWSSWHFRVVVALGITWVLDGLEVTIVGAIGGRLKEGVGLSLTDEQVGFAATWYLLGAVVGSLVFGYLTDRFGRKRLFLLTLVWYLVTTLASALSWNFASFALFRALTGAGIGGEYAAINSTIDELIPARRRGAVDLAVNGTWWFGTVLGSAASLVLLDPRIVDQHLGWRLAFGLGAALAVGIVFVRRSLPESPRWLVTHGREREAESVVAQIERDVRAATGGAALEPARGSIELVAGRRTGFGAVFETMLARYPKRTALALVLMISQAFLYNAIFFTESLVLTTFFGVDPGSVGLYIFPIAIGNLLGPLVLGRFFDSIGRRAMIAGTYAVSAILLIGMGLLFTHGLLDARTITLAWMVIFFFASAGASSAYLTVSEIFPLETRAAAIAIVYAVGTLVGGAAAPALFGRLIATKDPAHVFVGYAIGAGAMLVAAVVQWYFGVEAAGKSLEEVAPPLGSAKAVG
jgi:MFS family permease